MFRNKRRLKQLIVSLYRKGKNIPDELESLKEEALKRFKKTTNVDKKFFKKDKVRTKKKIKISSVLRGKPQASATIKPPKKQLPGGAGNPFGITTPKKPNSAARAAYVVSLKVYIDRVISKKRVFKIKKRKGIKNVWMRILGEKPNNIGTTVKVNGRFGSDISAPVALVAPRGTLELGNKSKFFDPRLKKEFCGRLNKRSIHGVKKIRKIPKKQ